VVNRGSKQKEARKLGLTGFGKNLPEGTVEIEVRGDSDDVDRLLEWCRQGPPDSKVTRITSEVIARVPGEGVFEIRR